MVTGAAEGRGGGRQADRRVVAEGRTMSRRTMLAALGFGSAAGVVVAGCSVPAPTPVPPPGAPEPGRFPDGVMAGDPLSDGAVIWTRVLSPDPVASVGVLWTVAEDPAFTRLRAGGVVAADATTGHQVKVRVDGLRPDRWYHYRFEVPGPGGGVSRTGRLRTAPAPGARPDRLRFAFASCQQINDSWFVAHRALAAEPDLDFLVHLGDYVYVSDTSTLSLGDYRACYRRWREQPYLRDLHAALPCVAMWDDGEFYNGVDRTGPPDRLDHAKQAWFEAFPLLDPGGRRTYRSLGWGTLADLPVIDVRAYRDPALDPVDYSVDNGQWDPDRTTLGAEQFAWLTGLLSSSTARWRLVGSGYNISPWRLVNLEFLRPFRPDMPPNAGIYAPNEAWDDYLAERKVLLRTLADQGVSDTVFCSGHTHVYLASELRPDPDDPSSPVVAYDFCNGSLTADPDPRRAQLGDLPLDVAEAVLRAAEGWVITQNAPNLRYMNLVDQGYTVVEVTPESVEVTVRLVDTFDPAATATDGARFRVRRGVAGMETVPVPGGRGTTA